MYSLPDHYEAKSLCVCVWGGTQYFVIPWKWRSACISSLVIQRKLSQGLSSMSSLLCLSSVCSKHSWSILKFPVMACFFSCCHGIYHNNHKELVLSLQCLLGHPHLTCRAAYSMSNSSLLALHTCCNIVMCQLAILLFAYVRVYSIMK